MQITPLGRTVPDRLILFTGCRDDEGRPRESSLPFTKQSLCRDGLIAVRGEAEEAMNPHSVGAPLRLPTIEPIADNCQTISGIRIVT